MSYQYGLQLIYNASESISLLLCTLALRKDTPIIFYRADPSSPPSSGQRRLCQAGFCVWITESAPLTCLGKNIKPTFGGRGRLVAEGYPKKKVEHTNTRTSYPAHPIGCLRKGENLERSVHHRRFFPLHPERMGRPVSHTLTSDPRFSEVSRSWTHGINWPTRRTY